jgi:hypothetical protein
MKKLLIILVLAFVFAACTKEEEAGWPKYTAQNGANMIFDNQCQVKNYHDQELLQSASGNKL